MMFGLTNVITKKIENIIRSTISNFDKKFFNLEMFLTIENSNKNFLVKKYIYNNIDIK